MEKEINQIQENQIKIRPARTFDFYVLLFFLLSFAGWVWEIGVYFVTEQVLVNCGVYRGPYLPIYGTGGLLLWFSLQKLHQRPGWTFLFSMVICTLFEYVSSIFLEWTWGVRWWDYSGYFLNFQGRVCLLGAVCFGLFGMAQNCFLLPLYMRFYHRLSVTKRWILCGVMTAVFVLDVTYCTVNPNLSCGFRPNFGWKP